MAMTLKPKSNHPNGSGIWPPLIFSLFPKLKAMRKGKYFTSIEEIKEKSKQELLKIPKSAFQKCFED